MATKYWVNGGVDNNWATAGNWSTSSGGAGGSGQPGSADTAIFDAGSAGYNCDLTVVSESTADINFTGYTGTFNLTGRLLSYGDVTLGSGMTFNGTGTWWFYEDNTGGLITSNGITWPVQLYWGGISGATWTLQDDMTCSTTGTINFQATDDSSANLLNNGGSYLLILTGNGVEINTGNGNGSFYGSGVVDIRNNCTLYFTNDDDNYGNGLTFHMTTAHTLTLKGYNLSRVCRFYSDFTLKLDDVATLDFDINSIPDDIPYFYGAGTSATGHIDTGNQQVMYRVYHRSTAGTAYWYDDTDGAENTIVYMNSNETTVNWRLYNYGSKLHVNQMIYNSSSLTAHYIYGDGDIEFNLYSIETNTTTNYTYYFQGGLTSALYTFWGEFRVLNNTYGIITYASGDGTYRCDLNFYHNCHIDAYNVAYTRIDAEYGNQTLWAQGDDAIITDCLNVQNTFAYKAYHYIDGTTPGEHPMYHNMGNGKNPVTVSGTVELSASPQQNAIVIIICKETESPDANRYNGVDPAGWTRDYYWVHDVLVTDASGQWSTTVPNGVEVIAEAHYDSGSQKYNSLSKPYISAT